MRRYQKDKRRKGKKEEAPRQPRRRAAAGFDGRAVEMREGWIQAPACARVSLDCQQALGALWSGPCGRPC